MGYKFNPFTGTLDIDDEAGTSAIPLSEKGQPNGVAELDGAGKVPVSQLPNSIMQYVGMWDASTNTPPLADGAGNADEDIGNVYRVSVAGTQDLGNGPIIFNVGDYAILNDSKIWEKADTTDSVVSVNGMTGVVALDTDDIPEGSTNLYFTTARARTAAVVDAISDGIIDIAPSQNAVFDALALKANQNLGNLTSPTAINQHLLFDTNATRDIGSNTNYARTMFVHGPVSGGTGGVNVMSSPTNTVIILGGGVTTPVSGVAGTYGVFGDAASTNNMFFGSRSQSVSTGGLFLETGNMTGTIGSQVSGLINVASGNHTNVANTSTTGGVTISTGNNSGTGVGANSGNMLLTVGTVTGAGIRGQLILSARNLDLTNAPLGSNIRPETTGSFSVGTTSQRFNTLFLTNRIEVGSNLELILRSSSTTPSGTSVAGISTESLDRAIAVYTENRSGTATSHNILLETGNVSGAGISGNIISRTGTTVGGTRGKLKFVDGTEGTIGHVWTQTAADGTGSWQVAGGGGGGANTSLSNLIATAINQDLIADTNNTRNLGSAAITWQTVYAERLRDAADIDSIHIQNRTLNDSTGATSAAYSNRTLIDSTGDDALDWQGRILLDNAAGSALTWDDPAQLVSHKDLNPDGDITRNLGSTTNRWAYLFASGARDTSNQTAIDFQSRTLNDGSSQVVVDWTNGNLQLLDGTQVSVDWLNRTLIDELGTGALTWSSTNRKLIDEAGNDALEFTSTNRLLKDSASSNAIDFENRLLTTGAVTKLDWSGTDISVNTRKIVDVVDPTAAQDAATKNYVDTADLGKMNTDFSNADPAANAIDLGGNLINNVADPVAAQDAATKNYVDDQIALAPQWHKYTVSESAFTAGSSAENVELFSLPAKGTIHAVVIKHTTSFTGGSISAFTLSVGISGNLTKYASAFDVFQATGTNVSQATNSFDVEDFSSATSIRLAANSVGGNVVDATAGSVDVYVLWGVLP